MFMSKMIHMKKGVDQQKGCIPGNLKKMFTVHSKSFDISTSEQENSPSNFIVKTKKKRKRRQQKTYSHNIKQIALSKQYNRKKLKDLKLNILSRSFHKPGNRKGRKLAQSKLQRSFESSPQPKTKQNIEGVPFSGLVQKRIRNNPDFSSSCKSLTQYQNWLNTEYNHMYETNDDYFKKIKDSKIKKVIGHIHTLQNEPWQGLKLKYTNHQAKSIYQQCYQGKPAIKGMQIPNDFYEQPLHKYAMPQPSEYQNNFLKTGKVKDNYSKEDITAIAYYRHTIGRKFNDKGYKSIYGKDFTKQKVVNFDDKYGKYVHIGQIPKRVPWMCKNPMFTTSNQHFYKPFKLKRQAGSLDREEYKQTPSYKGQFESNQTKSNWWCKRRNKLKKNSQKRNLVVQPKQTLKTQNNQKTPQPQSKKAVQFTEDQ